MSDQYYPATNGNNVYFTLAVAGTPQNTVWLGNASAATAAMTGTTLDTAFFGAFTPAAGPAFTIANLNGLAVDATDPANLQPDSRDKYTAPRRPPKAMSVKTCQGTSPA